MSRADQKTAKRGVGGHIKEGFKNIPTLYGALYNAKTATGAHLGVKNTVKGNVKTVLTGSSSSGLPKQSGARRAAIAGAGASSVTPLGPIVAFGLGVKKSIADKKQAKQNIAPKTKK